MPQHDREGAVREPLLLQVSRLAGNRFPVERGNQHAIGQWSTVVHAVLQHAGAQGFREALPAMVVEPPLDDPAAMAGCSATQLAARLPRMRQPERAARWLVRLATWWNSQAGALPPRETIDASRLHRSLMAVDGLPRILVDTILLLACGQAVMPIDRSVMRVALRHGWLDREAAYEEWQEFFRRGLADAGVPHARFFGQILAVGRKYCRKQPVCEACPLREVLPPGGPLEPGDFE